MLRVGLAGDRLLARANALCRAVAPLKRLGNGPIELDELRIIDVIAERLRADDVNANANLPRLARLAEVWEKINRAARDTAEYNLERKPLVFSVFGMLAEAIN